MLATATSFTLDGIEARRVRVEVDVHRGLPTFAIVGLPDTAVREARERVRAAIANSGLEFPMRRVTVNLAPAGLRKVGPGLDLAIAAALLVAAGQLDWPGMAASCLAGELALDGRVCAVPGALAMAEAALRAGAERILLPAPNAEEAALAPGIDVIGIETLDQLIAMAEGGGPTAQAPIALAGAGAETGERTADSWSGSPDSASGSLSGGVAGDYPDLADLRGQPHLRQALEVAAAGGHSLLMIGPPGVGKSLAARRLPSILPPLSPPETLEVARIASACGRLDRARAGARVFRAPHHTISAAGMVGGGNPPRPGEVTLAHRGVLFLDELCEFHRDALEALRAPIESGRVAIARSTSRTVLPARFMLVAASNPCPCGRGPESAGCICSVSSIQRYQSKLSGALADRIDIVISLDRPSPASMNGEPGESSAIVRQRVVGARRLQEERLGEGCCNAEMGAAEAREQRLAESARNLLERACERSRLSGRAHDRILRLARTLADLAGREEIGADEIGAALALRRREAR